MAPTAKAFHNQRPRAIADTGFLQPAATGHCSHRPDLYVQLRSEGSHLGSRQLARNVIGLWSGIPGLHGTAHGKTVSDGVQLLSAPDLCSFGSNSVVWMTLTARAR